jgi:GntR family transcriptional repressor for pyruvate dehydrogenase complex
MVFDQVRQRRLSDDIVDRLEGMILEGTLTSGQRLPAERVLAEQFGVSRPSLREAIQKLVAKGLLVSRQGGATMWPSRWARPSATLAAAARSSPEAQRDLLEFRHTLEASCAYYAAQRATEPDRERLKAAFDALQDCYSGSMK